MRPGRAVPGVSPTPFSSFNSPPHPCRAPHLPSHPTHHTRLLSATMALQSGEGPLKGLAGPFIGPSMKLRWRDTWDPGCLLLRPGLLGRSQTPSTGPRGGMTASESWKKGLSYNGTPPSPHSLYLFRPKEPPKTSALTITSWWQR